MKPIESDDRRDPERLLARGLRDTTPAFEARFDELRRRLANEGARRSWVRWLADALRWHPVRAGVVATVATLALAVAAIWVIRPGAREPGHVADGAWYVHAAELDSALRGGLALTSAEAREVVARMPVETPGGGS